MTQEYAGPPRARIQESTRGYPHQAVASAHTQTRCVGRLKLGRGELGDVFPVLYSPIRIVII